MRDDDAPAPMVHYLRNTPWIRISGAAQREKAQARPARLWAHHPPLALWCGSMTTSF
jgi:hypothetical protein